MSRADLLPELTERLDRLVPPEAPTLDWDDVLRRVVPAPAPVPRRTRRRYRLLLVAVALLLLLAGIATGTYFALRGGGNKAHGLTIFTGDPAPYAPCNPQPGFGCGPLSAIGAVQPNGRLKIVWRCPHPGNTCGNISSIAWSRDGRGLAFTTYGFAGPGYYDGLHIIDTVTHSDLQLPRRGPADSYTERATRELGCAFPNDVAWSADGRRLAYACRPEPFATSAVGIFVISADGSRRVAVPAANGRFPSWSPDGTRLAFATGTGPAHSSVYVVNLGGSGRMLVAHRGTAPAWSPDGKTIAYRARCGLRLVTPTGGDVTPPALAAECGEIHDPGFPAWSPDGTRLAFAGPGGVYVVTAHGGRLARVTRESGRGVFGPVRPAWTPTPRFVHSHEAYATHQRCC